MKLLLFVVFEGFVEDFIDNGGGDDEDAVALADEEVAGGDGDGADADGDLVVGAHHEGADTGGVAAAEVDADGHGGEIRDVAHAAIDEDAGTATDDEARRDHSAGDGGVAFSAGVEDEDVAGEGFFGGAVVKLRAGGVEFLAEVFAIGEVADGAGPADEAAVGVEGGEFVDEAEGEAFACDGGPSGFETDPHEAAEEDAIGGAELVRDIGGNRVGGSLDG